MNKGQARVSSRVSALASKAGEVIALNRKLESHETSKVCKGVMCLGSTLALCTTAVRILRVLAHDEIDRQPGEAGQCHALQRVARYTVRAVRYTLGEKFGWFLNAFSPSQPCLERKFALHVRQDRTRDRQCPPQKPHRFTGVSSHSDSKESSLVSATMPNQRAFPAVGTSACSGYPQRC